MKLVRLSTELVYCHTGPTPSSPELEPSFKIVHLNQDAVDFYFGQRDEDQWRLRAYRRHLASGCLGQLIAQGDQWASVGWVSTPTSDTPPHLSRRIIGARYWTFHVHTLPSFRGRGLQKAGLRLRVRAAREHSASETSKVYTDVAPDNLHSRQAKLSIGFEPAGTLRLRHVSVLRGRVLIFGAWNTGQSHPSLVAESNS